mmetsp:Transcript_735/g.1086  ORF Transcript_735/g.1086 Transcript_735/m.1086 type:complete len:413 (+) Transcript_735:525-1763(+)
MITKEIKKPAAAAPAPAPAATTSAAAPTAAPAPAATSAATTAPAPAATTAATGTPAPAAATTASAAPAAAGAGTSPFVTPEGVAALTGMGFPESESRAALAAAMGNPDLAYEFLLTGIPPGAAAAAAVSSGAGGAAAAPASTAATFTPAATTASAAAGEGEGAAAGGSVSIESLRRHPQFNMLKQLVQSNPAALSQVLDLIGQQSPELLAAIHANNDAFIAMMNEPISDTPPPPAPAPAAAAGASAAAAAGVPPIPGMAGLPPPGAGGMPDPAQMMQMMAALPAPQRAAFAQSLGIAPEQLEGLLQMMQSLPPGQMEAMMAQMGGGAAGRGGAAPGGGADPPGVIRLTEEEMAAVNRLVALGFTQQQAAQAYLACDKNETLAANLLFDGGMGWDDDGGGAGGGGGGDDNMYN